MDTLNCNNAARRAHNQLRHLFAVAEAVANREPADVVSRWERSARRMGANEAQLDTAVVIGLEKRRQLVALH